MKEKVWIVMGGWQFEGYDEPVGVYSTKERAEEVAALVKEKAYDKVTVFERELEAEPVGWWRDA